MNFYKGLRTFAIAQGLIILYGVFLRSMWYLCRVPMIWDCYVRFLTVRNNSYLALLNLGHSIHTRVHDPYGILLIQKFIISIFGDSIYAARLFVFACGVLSLILFQRTTQLFVGRYAGIVALALFTLSKQLIEYSVLLNAYASDVLTTLILYSLLKKMRDATLSLMNIIKFSFITAGSIWFSLPAMFILTGGFLALGVEAIAQKKQKRILGYGIVLVIWLASFLVYYHYALSYFVDLLEFHKAWTGHFIPFTTDPRVLGPWIKEHFYMMFNNPLGIYPLVGIILFLIGFWDMLKRRIFQCMVLMFPFILVMMASSLGYYPYWGRAIIFLVPACYLFIGQGWEFIFRQERKYYKPIVSLALLIFLLYRPMHLTYPYIFLKPYKHPMSNFLTNIKRDFQEGDIVRKYTNHSGGI